MAQVPVACDRCSNATLLVVTHSTRLLLAFVGFSKQFAVMQSIVGPATASGRCHPRVLQPQPLQCRMRCAPVISAKHNGSSLLLPRPVAHQAKSFFGCGSCPASDLLHGARLNGSWRRQSSVGPLSSVGAAFAGFQVPAAQNPLSNVQETSILFHQSHFFIEVH